MKVRNIISLIFIFHFKIVLPQSTDRISLINTNVGINSTGLNRINASNCPFSLGNDKSFCLPFNYTINGPSGYNSYTWTPGGANTQNLTTSVAGSYTCTALKIGNNLVINGTFSAGNTGFTTNYTPGNGGTYGLLTDPGTAAVNNDPSAVHNNFQSFGDHTTGSGNMLICNGSTTANDIVWSQTINLNPNTNYLFSAWVASAWGPMTSAQVAELQFSINGTLIGPIYNASQNGGIWTNFFVNWNSGSSTSAVITIVDQNIVASGANDFALDDISFKEMCIDSDNILIIGNPLPTLTVSATNSIICLGSSTQLNAIGASTYTWTGGVINGTVFSPTVTTNYTVTGASTAGCTNTAVQSITVKNLPTVTVNNGTTCAGVSTLLTANGATSYSWSNGASTQTISVAPLSQTIYTVIGTALGCTGIATSTVFINPTPTISVNNPTLCLGSSAILTANGSTNYTWSVGATTSSILVTPTVTTVYNVTGESSGCMGYNTSTVTINSLPIVTANATPSIICIGSSSMLNGSGASTYTWTGGVINGTVFSPTVTSNYTVIGTSAAGCTNTAVQSITVNNLPTVTVNNATTCAGVPALLAANGATSYSWSNGVSTQTISVAPLSQTIYTVIGTALGCTGTATSTVFISPTLNISVNNPTLCLGSSTILTANGATNYTWSTGATTSTIHVTPTVTSVYNVTGESSGCMGYNTSTVTINSLPIVTANATPSIICLGNSSMLNASGASTYTWTGGLINGTAFSPTVTSNYTVIGTSAAGCTNTAVQSITVNNLPTVTVNNATTCAGVSTLLTAKGATSYSWSNGDSTQTITVAPLSQTIYTVIGTTLGCTGTATSTVFINPTLNISVNNPTLCLGSSTVLTANGATNYTWSTGATTSTIPVTPTVTTVYSITGESSGCMGYNTSTVTINSLPIVTANATPSIICIGNSSMLNASGASTYTWTGGVINGTVFSPTVTSNYTVIGTSAAGCTNTAVQSITVNNLPTVTVTNGTACIGSSASMKAFGATSYTWSPSYGLSATTGSLVIANPNTTTVYSVSGTNNGCLGSSTGTMVVFPLPTVTFNASSKSVFESDPVEITVSGGGTYVWNNGSTSATINLNPTQTTVYCATVTSVEGCINSDCIQIPVLESSTLYIPSSFTPNEDGLNDVFYVMSTNIIKFEMNIFNRWGQLIFTSDDILKGWNGTYNGKEIQYDVYIYSINAKGIDNIVYKKTGHVTLVR